MSVTDTPPAVGPQAAPPITIGPFTNVPAPGSPIRSDWPQSISDYVAKLPLTQGGAGGFTTNASGDVGITFPTAFKAGTVPVVVICGNTETQAEMNFAIQAAPTPVSATGFAFRAFNTNTGTAQVNTIVGVSWLAFGTRP